METLADAKAGRRYRVVGINGGRSVYERLYDMGILPGTVVEVINQSFLRGPIRVRVGGSDVAIGRGVAVRIVVEEFNGPG